MIGVIKFIFAIIWFAIALGMAGTLLDATVFMKDKAAKAYIRGGISHNRSSVCGLIICCGISKRQRTSHFGNHWSNYRIFSAKFSELLKKYGELKMELKSTSVSKSLDKKLMIFGFEVPDLLALFLLISTLNFFFGTTSLKIYFVWMLTESVSELFLTSSFLNKALLSHALIPSLEPYDDILQLPFYTYSF